MPDNSPDPGPGSQPTPDGRAATAAVLLIGDELLTGKIRDENGWYLTRFLRRHGISLREISVVGDSDADIGAALLRLAPHVDLVFTSGGVGPTHDDRTLTAIAAATGRPTVRHAGMEGLLREHFGENITDAALAMADLPEGTVPCALPGWPVLRLDLQPRPTRIYILPGVPALLRSKLERLETIDGELPRAAGWVVHAVDLKIEETQLAAHLDAIVAEFPRVDVGSYPRWEPDADGRLRSRVHVTFEAPAALADAAREARDALCAALPDAVLASGGP